MKRITILSKVLLALIFLASCGSAEKTIKTPKGEVELIIPCSNFSSDKKMFRVSAFGESRDMNIAKKKALSNARTQLAGEISSTMKVVGENYVQSTESNNVEEILEQFEEKSRTVIDEKLNGSKSVCERVTQDKQTGNYKSYIALELSGEELVSKYREILSKDEKLKVDYNSEKFNEVFELEMNKK